LIKDLQSYIKRYSSYQWIWIRFWGPTLLGLQEKAWCS